MTNPAVLGRLRALKPNARILVRMAERGQILELKCQMPQQLSQNIGFFVRRASRG